MAVSEAGRPGGNYPNGGPQESNDAISVIPLVLNSGPLQARPLVTYERRRQVSALKVLINLLFTHSFEGDFTGRQ